MRFSLGRLPLTAPARTVLKASGFASTPRIPILLRQLSSIEAALLSIRTAKHRLSTSLRSPSSGIFRKEFVRLCSYQRTMCKLHDMPELEGSAVDVSKGREVLPTNVKPMHYDLTLEPNLETFEYEGKVVIDLDVMEDTTSISLNTLDLKIHSTEISADSVVITSTPELHYNEDTQTTRISFPHTIPAGKKATLTHTFTGTLNNNMAGFYRSSYKGKDGSTQHIATTQMEPTDARRAFPCFDEPALKAEFTITLIADKQLTCLSNMDAVSETEVDSKMVDRKKKAVTFRKTPLMSTYLLAFIVGELNSIETNSFRVPVRVFATPDKDIEHGRFSLDLAAL